MEPPPKETEGASQRLPESVEEGDEKGPRTHREAQAHRRFRRPAPGQAPAWSGLSAGSVLPVAAPSSRAGLRRSVWPPPRVECRLASWQCPGLASRAPGLRGQQVGGSSVAARPASPSQRCRRGGAYDASLPRAWQPRWAIPAGSSSGGSDIGQGRPHGGRARLASSSRPCLSAHWRADQVRPALQTRPAAAADRTPCSAGRRGLEGERPAPESRRGRAVCLSV